MSTQPAYLTEPVFAFTCDLDWAPEEAITDALALFDDYSIPLTPFVTHDSPVIRGRFAAATLRPRVGIHPNFFVHSSHGVNQSDVIDTTCGLWPEARGFRSHGFFDTSTLTLALRERGFQWDSNLLLLLQEGLVPLAHFSGLVRFPVFWQDDVHVHKGLPYDLRETRRLFETPGLKVINVHPLHMSLNTASAEHYARSKDLPVKGLRFEGSGVRTLVTQLLEFVRDRSFQTAYLDDLFVEYDGVDEDAQLLRRTPYRWPPAVAPPMQRGRARAYAAAGDRDKTAMMQAEFDSRDRSDIYATSPDFNLRELGIEFIGEHLGEGRVLELGCGNGHALISLARATQAEMVGIDLSASMIEGARARAKQLESDLTGTLSFQQGDIRSLPFDADTFDYVISQGAIVTLPSRADQWQTIREIHRVLVDGGAYIMVEGTEDGFGRLNRVREAVGLPPFPSVSDENFSSLKFDEGELHGFLAEMFATEEVRYFGAYYLISRVLHPLLALPQPPRFAASINRKAREIDQIARDCGKLGHLVGYKLIARKGVSATSDVPNRQYEVAR